MNTTAKELNTKSMWPSERISVPGIVTTMKVRYTLFTMALSSKRIRNSGTCGISTVDKYSV
jgi:hypothetical protein